MDKYPKKNPQTAQGEAIDTAAMKRRRYTMTIIAIIALLAIFAAFTFAWFTGLASNKNNKIRAGELALELLTTSPTQTLAIKDYTTANHTTAEDLAVAKSVEDMLYKIATDQYGDALTPTGTRDVVSMDDNPHAFVKFLETSSLDNLQTTAKEIDGKLPDFRQQRPIIIYNGGESDMKYTVDFLTRQVKEQIDDANASLDTAYYFNYTPLVVDDYATKAGNADYKAAFPTAYDIPEGVLAGKYKNIKSSVIGGTTCDSNLQIVADNLAGAAAPNTVVNMAKNIETIDNTKHWDASKPTGAGYGDPGELKIAPHSCHIYMVDMGITFTAGNTYQNSDLTIDILLRTGAQGGDTIHYVNTETELADAIKTITGTTPNAGHSGDSIILTNDITVKTDLTDYDTTATPVVKPGIFNLVLNGYTLNFEGDKAALMVQFPDVVAGETTLQTMDVGSPEGGRILGADKIQIKGNGTKNACVVNWYSDIAARLDTATNAYVNIDTPDKYTGGAATPNEGQSSLVAANLAQNSFVLPAAPNDTIIVPGDSDPANASPATLDVPVTVNLRTVLQQRASRYTDYNNLIIPAAYGSYGDSTTMIYGDLTGAAATNKILSDGSKAKPYIVDSPETFAKMIYDLTGVKPTGMETAPAKTTFTGGATEVNYLITENMADIKNLPSEIRTFDETALGNAAAPINATGGVNIVIAPGKMIVGLDVVKTNVLLTDTAPIFDAAATITANTPKVTLMKSVELAFDSAVPPTMLDTTKLAATSIKYSDPADSDNLDDYLLDVSYGVGEKLIANPYKDQ